MNYQFFRMVVLAVAGLLWPGMSGCGERDPRPFEVQLVTSPPAQEGLCPVEGVGGLSKDTIRTVRLTFFDAELGAPSVESFLCDRLVDADESGAVFYLDTPKGSHLTVLAEAFGEPQSPGDATPLVASGMVNDLPFFGADEMPRIFMPLTGRMGCGLVSLSKARAFHTTTALPGGFALVAGGLVATGGEVTVVSESGGLLLTDELEIYSVSTGRFSRPELAGEDGIPRAFHSAFLVDDRDLASLKVLLLGGIAQGAVPQGDGVVKIRTGSYQPFRLSPDPAAAPAAPMLLTIDLTREPPLVTSSSQDLDGWPSSFFQAGASFGADGVCLSGGAASLSDAGEVTLLGDLDVNYADSWEHNAQRGSMTIPRLGHTVTVGADGLTGLVWGGNLGALDPAATVAELLTVQPAPPYSSLLTLDASSSTSASAIPTAFHTATLLEDGDVLLVGGFVVKTYPAPDVDVALNPDLVDRIVRIRRNGSLFEYYPQNAGELIPVGYHAAVALPDGSVLITGGSPYFEAFVTPCPDGLTALTCSVSQAWIFYPGDSPADGGLLQPLPVGELQVPRFGHTMTLLSNGSVLVVGGLRRDETALYTEPSAEIYNAATGSAAEDVPLHRPPGALYSSETVCPAY